MRHIITGKLFIFLIAILGYQVEAFSQNASSGFLVEGRVNNAQGEKAVGAAILVKGTTIGTATDTMGYFTLKVPSEESILVISHFSTPSSIEVALKGSKKVVVRLGEKMNPIRNYWAKDLSFMARLMKRHLPAKEFLNGINTCPKISSIPIAPENQKRKEPSLSGSRLRKMGR